MHRPYWTQSGAETWLSSYIMWGTKEAQIQASDAYVPIFFYKYSYTNNVHARLKISRELTAATMGALCTEEQPCLYRCSGLFLTEPPQRERQSKPRIVQKKGFATWQYAAKQYCQRRSRVRIFLPGKRKSSGRQMQIYATTTRTEKTRTPTSLRNTHKVDNKSDL